VVEGLSGAAPHPGSTRLIPCRNNRGSDAIFSDSLKRCPIRVLNKYGIPRERLALNASHTDPLPGRILSLREILTFRAGDGGASDL
jgi:hypothetical protein